MENYYPTPAERSMFAKAMSHRSWARTTDRAARTAPAREALWRKFEDEVDPDRTLAPEERQRRALSARKAYYAALALKSAQVRRANKAKK